MRRFSASAAYPVLKYYSSWFCPFANRATIALEHHKSAVDYEWEEALGWQDTPPDGNEALLQVFLVLG